MLQGRPRQSALPRGVSRGHYCGYVAQVYCRKERVHLGTFDTPERAGLAYRIFRHFADAGYDMCKRPRYPKTRDAI